MVSGQSSVVSDHQGNNWQLTNDN